jgi:hypothetical protein
MRIPFRKPSDKWVIEAYDIIGQWGPVEGTEVKSVLKRHGRLIHHFDNRGLPYESMMKLLQEMVDISGWDSSEYRRRPLRIVNRDGDIMPLEVLNIRPSPGTLKAETEMDIQAGGAMMPMTGSAAMALCSGRLGGQVVHGGGGEPAWKYGEPFTATKPHSNKEKA